MVILILALVLAASISLNISMVKDLKYYRTVITRAFKIINDLRNLCEEKEKESQYNLYKEDVDKVVDFVLNGEDE